MKNFNDIELLSSYVDGQLNTTESKRLESRLASDPELASVLNDIRATRSILRKLPTRRAPRNFTLTRKMAGLKPPLPATYSLFRFSTAFATILLVLTFAVNSLPLLGSGAAPAPAFGMGGGGNDDPALQSAAATEAPAAATEAPAATEATAATEAPSAEILPAPAATTDESLREQEPSADTLQTPKEPEAESGLQNQATAGREALIPGIWQITLLTVILLSGLVMWIMRRSAAQKWQ